MRKDAKYKFFMRVIELSESKNWKQAKKEWEQIKITSPDEHEDYGSCICGKHPIKDMIQMFNSLNHNEIIVGNCCVNKFFEIKDFNKIFNAVKENRINLAMINDAKEKYIITEWEKKFITKLWRKKKLSPKRLPIFNGIKKRILEIYKK